MGRVAPTFLALAVAAGLAACGGGGHTTQSLPGHVTTPLFPHGKTTATTQQPPTLEIDAALPLSGPDSSQGIALKQGMELALGEAGEKAGKFEIAFNVIRHFNDASGKRGWDASALAKFVQKVATNPSTILYLGDLPSGASQVSIPILSAAGVPQIITGSPDSTLGSIPAGATSAHTSLPSNYVRLAPSNVDQARAILRALREQQHGLPACTKVAVAYGNDPDSIDLASQIKSQAAGYRPMVVLPPVLVDPGKIQKFQAYLLSIKAQGANCAVLADTIAGGAVSVTNGLHEQLAPGARIIGSSGICTSAWTNPAQGGVEAAIDPDLACTAPGPGLEETAEGRQFTKDFKHTYRIDPPDPAAAYGYEAMALGLKAIEMLGPAGNDRADVLDELRAITEPSSAIGNIGFVTTGTATGDTVNTDYSLYGVQADGTLRFERRLQSTAGSALASAAAATLASAAAPTNRLASRHHVR